MLDAREVVSRGCVVEVGVDAITGDFIAMYVFAAATFTLFTMPSNSGDAMTGFAVPAGTWIYGSITAFTMSSGKVIAYNK